MWIIYLTNSLLDDWKNKLYSLCMFFHVLFFLGISIHLLTVKNMSSVPNLIDLDFNVFFLFFLFIGDLHLYEGFCFQNQGNCSVSLSGMTMNLKILALINESITKVLVSLTTLMNLVNCSYVTLAVTTVSSIFHIK